MQKAVDITQYLPHKQPFLMADEVIEINDAFVRTVFQLKDSNILLENGRWTESGIIENMAQTCSTIFGQSFFLGEKEDHMPVIGFITSIKKVIIYNRPTAGSKIICEAHLKSKFGDICSVECRSFTQQELLAEAEINLFITKTPS